MKKVLQYVSNLWYSIVRIGQVGVIKMEDRIPILDVAKYIVHKFNKEGSITQLKLQKLLYFTEAYYMVEKNRPLFNEKFKAYTYGPVCFEVYDYYRAYRDSNIDDEFISDEEYNKLTPYISIIDEVCNAFGAFSASQLVSLTHENGSPWKTIYDRNGGSNSGNLGTIPKDLTKKWFKERFIDG